MALRLFNTLSRSVQEFTPLDPTGKHVGMYCCGPTVYDYAHIGNWRTFVFADLVRRYLEFKGYSVHHVMNITDVEDKIIRRVAEKGVALRDYTADYEQAFRHDLQLLLCRLPHQTPQATDHIPDIVDLIGRLVQGGLAYQAPDRSVYFSIDKFRAAGGRYGQLLKLNFEEMRTTERVKSDDYAKESVADFALWKARVPEDGKVFWASPWGEGRPGWHIECSAMSMKLLGESFDLHLGGEDLVFPHHEDEIAQSEGATGKPFVRHWLHGAHLLVEGRKMSKSAGNYFTLRDLTARGFAGREIRYLLLTAHYRETFNFTLDGLQGARAALGRIDECLRKLRETAGPVRAGAQPDSASAWNGDAGLTRSFAAALDEDLNISAAWGSVFSWVSDVNRRLDRQSMKPEEAAAELAAWDRIDSVLAVGAPAETQAPPELLGLLEQRRDARAAKNFKRADEIRDELKAKGWVIEDTPKGPRLKKA